MVTMFGFKRFALAGLLLAATCAHAVDWTVSGYGTLGYVVSDQDWIYQKHVDDDGTWWRDTRFGTQIDAKINPTWSATLQLTLSPSMRHDRRWATEVAWAFASWRPDNDWQLRVGKQRVPMYLHSENHGVGQTHVLATLPAEVYAMSPTNDFTGASITRTWLRGVGELSADVYAGRAQISNRMHSSDLGSMRFSANTDVVGAVLTWRAPELTWRLGLHHARSQRTDGQRIITSFPYVDLGGGAGYFRVSEELPGPPIPASDAVVNQVLNAAIDVEVAPGWRVAAEAARVFQRRTTLGADSAGMYVAAMREMGAFTPYVLVARQQSLGSSRQIAKRLHQIAEASPDPRLAVSQRAAAETAIQLYDQTSVGAGVSWAVGRRSQLKAEWMRIRIGEGSFLVDSPPGRRIRDENVQTWTLNYSFVF